MHYLALCSSTVFAWALPTRPGHNSYMQQRNTHSAMAVAPTEATWNANIAEAWSRAYSTATEAPDGYEIEEIEGSIPPSLRGTVFRNGPGNFERGGKRFEHVLDGDGLLCSFSIDGDKGRAFFRSRFVATPFYSEEASLDEVRHRNTFGTQRDGGPLQNFGDLTLKNPANTNIQQWGGKTLALWEAARPCTIDPRTLEYVGDETFDDLLPRGGLTVTTGFSAADEALGLGEAFTAHPREDRRRGCFVGWSWAAQVVGNRILAKIHEWDSASGRCVHTTSTALPSPVAPHDFAVTKNWYVFVLNSMKLELAPYILGVTGPVGALQTTSEGVTLHLVPRPHSAAARAGTRPLTIPTGDPYFAIHHATAFEEAITGTGGEESTRLCIWTAAWPRVTPGPFLGDWGGAIPMYDGGKIKPTLLLQTTITLPPLQQLQAAEKNKEAGAAAATAGVTVERSPVDLVGGRCIDHPHVDPRFDGDAAVRYCYMSYCNDEGESGSPPIGWCRYDRKTGEVVVWQSPKPRVFCEELVVIPRPPLREGGESGAESDGVGGVPAADEADVWLAGMMFDGDSGRSCLCLLDGDDLASGPVCKLWLKGHVPHGLHGCFSPELYN